MLIGRELHCDFDDRMYFEVPAGEPLPAYTPLDFCQGCVSVAAPLLLAWVMALQKNPALAKPLITLVNQSVENETALMTAASDANKQVMTYFEVLATETKLTALEQLHWTHTVRLAEAATFLARLEPASKTMAKIIEALEDHSTTIA